MEESGILINKEIEFVSMLSSTLVASLLEILLTGKNVKAKIPKQWVITAGEGTIRVSQEF